MYYLSYCGGTKGARNFSGGATDDWRGGGGRAEVSPFVPPNFLSLTRATTDGISFFRVAICLSLIGEGRGSTVKRTLLAETCVAKLENLALLR